jgi:hypothetical protein
MTEAEWLECSNPIRVVECLRDRDAVSARAWMLFACACCRRLLIPDGPVRLSLDTAERFALGAASRTELSTAYERVNKLAYGTGSDRMAKVVRAVRAACCEPGWQMSLSAALYAQDAGAASRNDEEDDGPRNRACRKAEAKKQADLARHIFGNPFCRLAAAPHWLTQTVRGLAYSIYADRDLASGLLDRARLCILADALEEAGVTDQEVLVHLRQTALCHVAGCWVLELLLAPRLFP